MTCTLDPRGGTCSPLSFEIAVNTAFGTKLPTPTKNQGRFLGWYNFDLFGSQPVTSSTKVVKDQAFTLYARWQSTTTSAERVIIKPRRGNFSEIDLQANEFGFVRDQNLFAMADPTGTAVLASGLGNKAYFDESVFRKDQTLAQGHRILLVDSGAIRIVTVTGKNTSGWTYTVNATIAPAADASEAVRQILSNYYNKNETESKIKAILNQSWKVGGTWPAAGLESYLSSNFVTLTTAQTITGAKTWTADATFNSTIRRNLSGQTWTIVQSNTAVTRGTTHSDIQYFGGILFRDKSANNLGYWLASAAANTREVVFTFRTYGTGGQALDQLVLRRESDNSSSVRLDANSFVKLPAVTDSSDGAYAATCKYVRDHVASAIDALKTELATIYQKKANVDGKTLVLPQ